MLLVRDALEANNIRSNFLVNMCGPMKTPSLRGIRFFITFIDNFSRNV